MVYDDFKSWFVQCVAALRAFSPRNREWRDDFLVDRLISALNGTLYYEGVVTDPATGERPATLLRAQQLADERHYVLLHRGQARTKRAGGNGSGGNNPGGGSGGNGSGGNDGKPPRGGGGNGGAPRGGAGPSGSGKGAGNGKGTKRPANDSGAGPSTSRQQQQRKGDGSQRRQTWEWLADELGIARKLAKSRWDDGQCLVCGGEHKSSECPKNPKKPRKDDGKGKGKAAAN